MNIFLMTLGAICVTAIIANYMQGKDRERHEAEEYSRETN
jgi:hypothetical protein